MFYIFYPDNKISVKLCLCNCSAQRERLGERWEGAEAQFVVSD